VVDGEVVDGESTRNRWLQRLGLEYRQVPGLGDGLAQSPVP
jgi:hypothetical protein